METKKLYEIMLIDTQGKIELCDYLLKNIDYFSKAEIKGLIEGYKESCLDGIKFYESAIKELKKQSK